MPHGTLASERVRLLSFVLFVKTISKLSMEHSIYLVQTRNLKNEPSYSDSLCPYSAKSWSSHVFQRVAKTCNKN